MILQFPAADIPYWAAKYDAKPDRSVLTLKAKVQADGYLTKPQLLKVAKWKSPRSAGNVLGNSAGYVQEVTAFALKAADERARIESLTLLDGVLWPTASVILHLYHADPYPILDFRALWSVGIDVPKQYTFSFWESYVAPCRKIARNARVDMRTLDRALWQYSKEKQQ